MQRLDERDVIAARFWKHLDDITGPVQSLQNGRRYALFLIFLHLLDEEHELHGILATHINWNGFRNNTPPSNHKRGGYFWILWLNEMGAEDTVARAIQKLFHKFVDVIGSKYRADIFGLPSEYLRTSAMLHAVSDLVSHDVDRDLVVHVFDYGFFSMFSSKGSTMGWVDKERDQYLSVLASILVSDRADAIGDFYSNTGQFAINASKNLSSPLRSFFGYKQPLSPELLMRLLIYRIQYATLDQDINRSQSRSYPFGWSSYIDVAVIDPPINSKRKNRDWRSTDEWNESEWISAANIAKGFTLTNTNFRLAIFVVPFADTYTNKWHEVRNELVANDQLLAVIDLPRNLSKSTRVSFSVWVVCGQQRFNKAHIGNILFINGDALSHLETADDADVAAQFMAKLVLLAKDDDHSQSPDLTEGSWSRDQLAKIFRREFGDGYRDTPGLCELVRTEVVLARDSILNAKAYLSINQNEPRLRALDRSKLQACLDDPQMKGKRIYVIGNNGEGKSLLLRELAENSSAVGRKTIAIALGTADRFHFIKKSVPERYLYLGTKTSANRVDLQKIAILAGQLMTGIHADSKRAYAFNEVASLIGFSADHFLIPVQTGAGSNLKDGLFGGIIRLTSDSSVDRQMLDQMLSTPKSAGKYKLGVRRFGDRDAIIPFDELSSGEQQIILLAAKIVAHAEEGALFLIDEPEISLHVSWQRAIPKVLAIIAHSFHSDMVIATHSPVLISSAIEEGDFCFTARDGKLSLISEKDRRSVETVLFEGFRTYTPNNREVHEQCAALVAESIDIANQEDINIDAHDALINKLVDMRSVVASHIGANRTNDFQADVDLIERAKAAIEEIVRFNKQVVGKEL